MKREKAKESLIHIIYVFAFKKPSAFLTFELEAK